MKPSSDAVAANKAAIRRQVLARRDGLSPEVRAELSLRISARVLSLAHFQAARTVLAYMSFGSEFDTRTLIDHVLTQGKTLLLPRVDRATRSLCLHRVADLAREMASGTWGILEPRPTCAPARLADADCVLVPGVAFTASCERLGYGAGFYDRLIASGEAEQVAQPKLVAAVFDTQLIAQLPVTATDRGVDLVVTETTTYTREGGNEP